MADDELQNVIRALEVDRWPPETIKFQAFKKFLWKEQGILLRENRIVIPNSLKKKVMEIAHRGHPGSVTMKKIIRENLWWPKMDQDIENFNKRCLGCTVVARLNPPEPLIRKEMPSGPWREIAIDFLKVSECGTNFLVLIDYFSRYLVVKEIKVTNAVQTISILQSVFKQWTYPDSIRADNGPPFDSKEFTRFCSSRNIELVNTIPYWPQMNGEVERQNVGIIRALKIAKALNQPWKEALREYVYTYNIRPHSVTGKSPFELMTGRRAKDLLPLRRTDEYGTNEDVYERDKIEKLKGKIYTDERRNAKESEIEIGDDVLIKNREVGKLQPNLVSYHLSSKRHTSEKMANL